MKFAAVVLLACVAVSSAAFTANLVQHTQPALAKAMFNLRLAAGSNKASSPGLKDAVIGIIAQIQTNLISLLAGAADAAAHGVAMVTAMQEHVTTFVDGLQAPVSAAQHLLHNLLTGIQTSLGLTKGSLSLSELLTQANLMSNHIFNVAQGYISQISWSNVMTTAMDAFLPQNVVQMVVAHINMNANNKGLFDGLLNALGGLWNSATGSAYTFAAEMADLMSAIGGVGQNGLAGIQSAAHQFVQGVHLGASTISAAAAEALMGHMGAMHEALGDQWQETMDALTSIANN